MRCIHSLILRLEVDISTPPYRHFDRLRSSSKAGGGLHNSVILDRSHDSGCLGQRPTCDFSSMCKVCTAPPYPFKQPYTIMCATCIRIVQRVLEIELLCKVKSKVDCAGVWRSWLPRAVPSNSMSWAFSKPSGLPILIWSIATKYHVTRLSKDNCRQRCHRLTSNVGR